MKNITYEHNNVIGYCGWDCSSCGNYKKNLNCRGCRVDQEMISDCDIRTCAKGRVSCYCCECPEFPCSQLQDLYKESDKGRAAFERLRSR